MSKHLDLWSFVAEYLRRDERVMLLVVVESSGSSPGRPGYKMAVSADGGLCGSIGGGIMEVNLVERSRTLLSVRDPSAGGLNGAVEEQVHVKNLPNSSGMICSGKQTVVFKQLTSVDLAAVQAMIDALVSHRRDVLVVTNEQLALQPPSSNAQRGFARRGEADFLYTERLGTDNQLVIVGGGHCALALSDLMSRMDFDISIFDDRPDLNTLEKNQFAAISIIEDYAAIGTHVPDGQDVYVVVMTLGYVSDAAVIRALIEHQLKYFGVLGSKAKMAKVMKGLIAEGLPADKLARIHAPIGLAINSRTPEEIAVSIAAEIISIKNSD